MANLTYPGVYVEEVSSGVRPIQTASTSTAAFIGQAEKGSLKDAVKVYNFTEYRNLYGGFMENSYLSHAVYNYFNNGGSQCYIVRVAGSSPETANIVLKDRAASPAASLTVTANAPGQWGNRLALVITDGALDPANEFNLALYEEDGAKLLESHENLSMDPASPKFAETVSASSKYVTITVNAQNANVTLGVSIGAGAPVALASGKTKLRININGDGFQEVDLNAAVTGGKVADLSSAANIAAAISSLIKALVPLRQSTDATAFTGFTCALNESGALVMASGFASRGSSVVVEPATNAAEDASVSLKLGKANNGTEILGGSVSRPRVTPAGSFYLIGDNTAPTEQVAAVRAGSDGGPVTSDQSYIDAFARLDKIDDVSIIAVPGIGSPAVMGAGMNYCAGRPLSDCFFIGDMAQDDDTVEEAKAFAAAVSPKNSYGAVYTPWIRSLDPSGKSATPITVPPSGFIAGLYAKTDGTRGVWKAPAGVAAGLGGAVGLKEKFTDVEQGNLNPRNINCIRQFASSGIVVWGARTINADPEYGYIPVRRMAIMLRVSIYNGIQWAVFEPNDLDLWSQLRLNVRAFMMTQYRKGAFQGATPSEAFYVKCDGETTTQADIDLGVVNLHVGFAPLKPAEFVVVKISQAAGRR